MRFARLLTLVAVISTPFLSGCSTCCSTDDYNYPTYGGKWERTDRQYGRVGSIFTDGRVNSSAATPMMEPEEILPQPTPGEPVGTTILQ